MKKMNSTHPFDNDPFALVWRAFKTLWPDSECSIEWNGSISDENGEPVCGVTAFFPDSIPEVSINPSLEVWDAVEILAHELAHVAAGIDNGHGEEWEAAFDKIQDEYQRIITEEHPDAELQFKETHGANLEGENDREVH